MIMSDLSDDYSIKVYCTVTDLTEEAIFEFLRSDVLHSLEEVKDQFAIKFVPGQRPLQIFQYQNNNYKVPDYSEQGYFLIVDSVHAARDGLLLCNLQADHGFPDAVREIPGMAGMTAASLSIANSNWCEVREEAFDKEEVPIRRFAVYDVRTSREPNSFLRIAEAVDNGLHYAYDDPDDDEPPPLKQSLEGLFRYTAIEVQGHRSADELHKQHRRYVEEKDLDHNRLAVVDDKFAEEGLLLVQVEPHKEFRCKPPAAGELLWWNAVGLMSWDESEEFASQHSELEYKWTVDYMSKLQREAARDSEDSGLQRVDRDDSPKVGSEAAAQQRPEERRFRYYRTRLGKVVASMEQQDIPSPYTRPREESDGVDENGEMGPVEDVFVEELPWDYYSKTEDAEGRE